MAAIVGRDKHRRSDRIWWVIAVLAVIVAAGSVVGSLSTTEPGTVVLAGAAPGSVRSVAPTFRYLRRSLPVKLVIPVIGVSASIGVVGLQPNRQIMVPNNVRTVSWYRYGPTPGQIGSSAILGHVDSYTGPGVFFLLKTLKAGATIKVILADRIVTYFAVTKVVRYSKSAFPNRLIFGSRGTRSLNLITCGGVFDHKTGHYQSNIVVFSKLVKVSPPSKI